jgi:L-ascorbate 6-phosphate lactonase
MSLMQDIRQAAVKPGHLAVWWIGQAGFALRTPGGLTAFIDPYLSDARGGGGHHERFFPPPIEPEELEADVIFCSHDHIDHTDPTTLLPALRHTAVTIVAPGTSCALLAGLGVDAMRLHRLDRGDRYALGDLAVTATFALHAGFEAPLERRPRTNSPDAIGFLLECGPVRVYHTGDTLYDPQLRAAAAFRPQALLLPINGRAGNMNAAEAAELTRDIAPRVVIPMHYGCMVDNTADPEAFVAAVAAAGLPSTVVVLQTGQRYDLEGWE